ncbi:hypothetical protein [Paenibacillus xerothermodurans]|uniref:hypothetical protein n=1 Tax=Paenibacillus xerothermodurans TaxID=1977292 RepID=UPI00311D5D7F
MKIDIASVYNAASAPVKGTKKFAELVEQRANGTIKVNVFPNGQLGSEREPVVLAWAWISLIALHLMKNVQ